MAESATTASPFTFRPWPVPAKKPKTIAEFIARTKLEPGGFQAVDEDAIRREAEQEENGEQGDGSEAEDVDMDHNSESDDERDESARPVTVEDVIEARNGVLQNIQ